jgi:phosphatidylglycerol:prolipoprotein diacylglycerol transferase
MLVHPQFDPVAIQLGPLAIRWYGLMYLVAFVQMLMLARLRAKRLPQLGWTARDIDDALLYGVLGTILGGRLGYVLFYKPMFYLEHPLQILSVWEGGMSFHGGFLGVIVGLWIFSHRKERRWLDVTDFFAPCVPLGLGAGRLGNFINGELWGRPVSGDLPWGMWFPQADPAPLARHPSQLYEFGLEGIVLFAVLWLYARKPRPRGAVSGAFLLGYGTFRFIGEFAREPDNFLGFLALGWTMGQWLSAPMIIAGLALIAAGYRREAKDS